jgi:hypothetical protein
VPKVGWIHGRIALRAPSPRGLRSAPDVRRAPRRKPRMPSQRRSSGDAKTWSSGGVGPVSADGMREPLRHHGGDAIPSRRTISRMLKRQAKEGTAHGFPSSVCDDGSCQRWEQGKRYGPCLHSQGWKVMGEAELRVNQSRQTALDEGTLSPEQEGKKICRQGLDNSGNIEALKY